MFGGAPDRRSGAWLLVSRRRGLGVKVERPQLHTPSFVAAYHILDLGEPYRELGADYFVRRHDPERHARRLARQIQALGYDITIRPAQAA